MKLNLALTIGLLAFTLATPSLMAEHHEPTTKETPAPSQLEGYPAIATALYKDDLEAAKKAAETMATHGKDSVMTKHCKAIADSKTLEEARKHFKALSDLAIPIAKEQKTLYEVHCPMAFDNQGASWLQPSGDEVQNPYMGAKMPHCGKVVK